MNRYDIESKLGDGTFGTVFLASHKQHKHKVAIKFMKREFLTWDDAIDLREARILMSLSKHPNIVKIMEIIREENDQLYFVFEYMADGNLYEYMRKCTMMQTQAATTPMTALQNSLLLASPAPLITPAIPMDPLTPLRIMSITRQILEGLDHLHKHGYVHRDIKPENILLDGDRVKLADFGLTRECSSQDQFTEYISTRWYRAPEVLLRSRQYGKPIDLFALGCIVAELFSRTPLFPGKTEPDQLERQVSVLGVPSELIWPEVNELANKIGYKFPVNELGQRTHSVVETLQKKAPQAPPLAIQFIKDLLEWNPKQRPTAREALDHVYFVPMEMAAATARSLSSSCTGTASPTSVASHSPVSKKHRTSRKRQLTSPATIQSMLSTSHAIPDHALMMQATRQAEAAPSQLKRRRLDFDSLALQQPLVLDRPQRWLNSVLLPPTMNSTTPSMVASPLASVPFVLPSSTTTASRSTDGLAFAQSGVLPTTPTAAALLGQPLNSHLSPVWSENTSRLQSHLSPLLENTAPQQLFLGGRGTNNPLGMENSIDLLEAGRYF